MKRAVGYSSVSNARSKHPVFVTTQIRTATAFHAQTWPRAREDANRHGLFERLGEPGCRSLASTSNRSRSRSREIA